MLNRRRFLGLLGASVMAATASAMGMRTFAPEKIEGRVPASALDGLPFNRWIHVDGERITFDDTTWTISSCPPWGPGHVETYEVTAS